MWTSHSGDWRHLDLGELLGCRKRLCLTVCHGRYMLILATGEYHDLLMFTALLPPTTLESSF